MANSINKKFQRIEPLKKVVLSIAAGTTPAQMDLTPQPFLYEFIHGIGSTGLSPFEQELVDKGPGDELGLPIPIKSQKHFLGHLVFPPILLPPDLMVLHLEIRVEKIRSATNREIVRELARVAECGDGCCGH